MKLTTHVIHNRPDGSAWLIVNQTQAGWELDDGVWIREVETDGDLFYTLEREVSDWERMNGCDRERRVCDLGDLARQILRLDLRRYRVPD